MVAATIIALAVFLGGGACIVSDIINEYELKQMNEK